MSTSARRRSRRTTPRPRSTATIEATLDSAYSLVASVWISVPSLSLRALSLLYLPLVFNGCIDVPLSARQGKETAWRSLSVAWSLHLSCSFCPRTCGLALMAANSGRWHMLPSNRGLAWTAADTRGNRLSPIPSIHRLPTTYLLRLSKDSVAFTDDTMIPSNTATSFYLPVLSENNDSLPNQPYFYTRIGPLPTRLFLLSYITHLA